MLTGSSGGEVENINILRGENIKKLLERKTALCAMTE